MYCTARRQCSWDSLRVRLRANLEQQWKMLDVGIKESQSAKVGKRQKLFMARIGSCRSHHPCPPPGKILIVHKTVFEKHIKNPQIRSQVAFEIQLDLSLGMKKPFQVRILKDNSRSGFNLYSSIWSISLQLMP